MAAYRVMSGVHRCVAAHRAGLTEIRARIDTDGPLGAVVLIPLDCLYTTKSAIDRWDRRRDFLVLVGLFANEATRDGVPGIEVARVPERVAKYLTRIADVVVNSL